MLNVIKSARTLSVIIAIALTPGIARGQEASEELTLRDALETARNANPALRAMRLRADAAAERILPAGAFPDPQLMFGFINRPVDFVFISL